MNEVLIPSQTVCAEKEAKGLCFTEIAFVILC